jgi:membrane-associated protease RseP (regulator of RpoE activity)
MSGLMRRLRGLLGLGVTWGAGWAGIGAAIGLAIRLVAPPAWGSPILAWALGMGAYGFVSGVGFGKLLWFREGRKTLGELSLKRVALWGVLGSAAVPLVFALLGAFNVGTSALEVAEAMAVTACLGGTFAAGSVVIARKGELAAPSKTRMLAGRSEE